MCALEPVRHPYPSVAQNTVQRLDTHIKRGAIFGLNDAFDQPVDGRVGESGEVVGALCIGTFAAKKRAKLDGRAEGQDETGRRSCRS